MKHLQLTDELMEKASVYAAGAMTEDERQEYVRHLEDDDCGVCKQEVKEMQSAASLLALGLPTDGPSPSVKVRLMAQAEAAARQPRPQVARGWHWPVWASSAIAVAAVVLLAVALRDNA